VILHNKTDYTQLKLKIPQFQKVRHHFIDGLRYPVINSHQNEKRLTDYRDDVLYERPLSRADHNMPLIMLQGSSSFA